MDLITNSIVTIRSIWHNTAADFFAFWKIGAANLAYLVAPPTDGTTKLLVHCKAHPVLQQMAKTASKSMYNCRRYPSWIHVITSDVNLLDTLAISAK